MNLQRNGMVSMMLYLFKMISRVNRAGIERFRDLKGCFSAYILDFLVENPVPRFFLSFFEAR